MWWDWLLFEKSNLAVWARNPIKTKNRQITYTNTSIKTVALNKNKNQHHPQHPKLKVRKKSISMTTPTLSQPAWRLHPNVCSYKIGSNRPLLIRFFKNALN
jgi:hypothetical protein